MRRPVLLIVLLLIPPVAAGVVSALRTNWKFPNRFTEIVPDGVYRGGRPTADNLRSLAEDKSIRTVVNLTENTERAEERDMIAAAGDLNVKIIRVPMPGDGLAEFAAIDKAADEVANKNNWPVYFHCAAGKQRSDVVHAGYRIKHCGWTAAQAMAEMAREGNLDPQTDHKLCNHIARYAEWVHAIKPGPTQSVRKKDIIEPSRVP